jgi:oligopeptide transport system substrate-binding protein
LEPDLFEPVPVVPPSRRRRVVLGVIAILLVAGLVVAAWPSSQGGPMPSAAAAGQGGGDQVRILAGTPASIDPAKHGDLGSAAYVSQMYETLTAVDPSLTIQPALAESWTIADDGRLVTFSLRPGLTFSDGSPLTADDVVRSWRRLFLPGDPSPLASLVADVKGARGLLTGASSDTSTLGVRAEGDRTVVVELERGGGDLPAIVSGAPFAVVPPTVGDAEVLPDPGRMVGSGAYTLERVDPDRFVLKANPRYWAGEPAIGVVEMITTLEGGSAVEAFEAGDLDVAPISFLDAGWIAYDRTLGPSLRSEPDLSVTYYGFDTRQAPFDDVRVRQAFGMAVDWRRLAALDEPGSSVPATGMVPAGIPGTPEGDYLPPYDPAAARALLAEAGYPGGAGLPPISFIANGGGYDEGIVAMLEENLGVTIEYATMDFDLYQERLATDPPQIWSLSWVADYPGPNDFLGVLLGTGSTANQGGWSDAAFDAAIADASSAADPATSKAGYARALEIVRDQVPTVPVSYGTSFSLVRDGLLGAGETGTGILRLAGLAWEGEQ